MTVDYKDYLLNRDNLTQPIEIQLSQKKKKFWEFFFPFLTSTLHFKYLSKKDDSHSWWISGKYGSGNYSSINV